MFILFVLNFSFAWYTFLFLELYLGNGVAELFEVPTSLEFVRDYVAKNVPVLIRNAALEWPAVSKWNSKYFLYVVFLLLDETYEFH